MCECEHYNRHLEFCTDSSCVFILIDFIINFTNNCKRIKQENKNNLQASCTWFIKAATFHTVKMYPAFLIFLLVSFTYALDDNSITETTVSAATTTTESPNNIVTTEPPIISCTCAVFLSGQFKKGSKDPPKGNPALLHEQSDTFPCNNIGNKMCTNKCLDVIVKHLPNSPSILCGSIDRDCHKERAYLFIKNCKDEWVNTNLSAGREYCCKDGLPYKCPLLS